ncbi:hypothetical protein GF314_02520 [bacterium]|nr:hypothetical protein [bacterium]
MAAMSAAFSPAATGITTRSAAVVPRFPLLTLQRMCPPSMVRATMRARRLDCNALCVRCVMRATKGRPMTGLQPPPWEERDRYGAINALVLTIRLVLLEPSRFFGRMPVGLGLTQPVLFAMVLALVGAVLDWMWGLATGGLSGLVAPEISSPLLGVGALVFGPVIAVAMVFVRAGVFHLMLILLDGRRLGFEATARVVAYGRATRLLAVLPFCGGPIGLLWELVVDVIGLSRVHGCEPWKAAVAVLAPAVVALLLLASGLAAILGLSILA